ncbi:hypothetical protein ABZ439_37195 [Streptomyces sp. NPDC005840]|uniref:hypothetical protein n=1 Tax=Streptomyces sp. NPDC005840 TaxID=3157072 RepID=UPI0033DA1CF5
MEIDRRSEDATKRTVDLIRSRPDAIENVDHDKRLWRRFYLPTGREGLVPVAFVFAHTTEAKVANTVAVLEEAGRRYWAPRRYDSLYAKAITALDYRRAVTVVVTPPWSSSRSRARTRRCGGDSDAPAGRR